MKCLILIIYELQETYSRGNELQVPDCAHYFMENLPRFSDMNYVPTKVRKEITSPSTFCSLLLYMQNPVEKRT